MSQSPGIDPRGPRFTAGVTAVIAALVLLTAPSAFATTLVAVQTAFFAIGALRGVQHTPTAFLFRTTVRPRLAAPDHLEDPVPPRFAPAVGLVFMSVALVGYLSGATLLGAIATGFALGAAVLNSGFGLCLGCEVYLLARRITAPDPKNTNNPATNKEVVA